MVDSSSEKSTEKDLIRSLVQEVLSQVREQENSTVEALGVALAERLREIHTALAAISVSLDRLLFSMPMEETAHIAMRALLENARGPQDLEEVADRAYEVAYKMRNKSRHATKFGDSDDLDQESGDASVENAETLRPPSLPGDHHSAL